MTDQRPDFLVLGCGFLGTFLARQALEKGMRVTALTRNPEAAKALSREGIEVVKADLSETDWHERVPSGPTFVANCVSSGGGGLEGYRKSYLEGMKSILEWSRGARPGTYVYTSSTSVYPQHDQQTVTETDAAPGGSPAAEILLETENLLREGDSGFARWFILRLAGIYGPGRHQLLDRLREGATEMVGGKRLLNLVHAEDICQAVWRCFDAPLTIKDEIFNVADDEATTRDELITWLAEKLGRPAPALTAGDGTQSRRGSGDGPPPDRRVSNEKIKRVLGWSPGFRSFREGYEAMITAG